MEVKSARATPFGAATDALPVFSSDLCRDSERADCL
jgi:hypothetical protein